MTDMTDDQVRALLDGATPGPWEWGGHPDNLKLQTVHHGKLYVMDFVRKGFSGAQPRFQPAKRGMVNADVLLQFQVGDQTIVGEKAARADGSVYRYDVRGVDAPDARLIAAAPDLARALLDARVERDRLAAELAAANAREAGLRGAVEALCAVLDRNDKKGPIPDVEMMFCWLAAQGVRAAFRSDGLSYMQKGKTT